MSNSESVDVFTDFMARYEKWREFYVKLGQNAPDAPVWESGRLHLRSGYPHDGWTSYIVEQTVDGYNVFSTTTERRNTPLETLKGFFSRVDDAGKYIIWNAGEDLRVSCRVDPVGWAWEDLGLDPRVEQVPLEQYVSKYVLKADPTRYFVLQAGGIQPENRLLPLSYEELDELLVDGLTVH